VKILNADDVARLGPYRDIVLLNSAAALVVADVAVDLRTGVAIAGRSIDEGKAAAAKSRLKHNAALLCPKTLKSENETLKSFYISSRRC
jgi:anthranilate phosphoribosyltransferase